MKRRIVYVSGTRADFGLMRSTLVRAAQDPGLEIALCVTGMHLDPRYGHTVKDVEACGIPITSRIPVDLGPSDGAAMARAMGHALIGMVEALSASRPDAVMVLGDRGEMLAGALAALHLTIPVIHLHGGERSGTIDEPVRHAISKLAHYHFVATQEAQQRLLRMGEHAHTVFVTGAPGLDGLAEHRATDRTAAAVAVDLDPKQPTCLVVFHPIVQQAQEAGRQMEQVLAAALSSGMQVLCFKPNADAGAEAIRAAIEQHRGAPNLRVVTHLPRDLYLSWMQHAEVMLGNSSSGIIEAASFDLPVVNVGDRQRHREHGPNVIDCAATASDITAALAQARGLRGQRFVNPYGDGHAGERIVKLLATLPLSPSLLEKCNAY